jgi:hypothetical protein
MAAQGADAAHGCRAATVLSVLARSTGAKVVNIRTLVSEFVSGKFGFLISVCQIPVHF